MRSTAPFRDEQPKVRVPRRPGFDVGVPGERLGSAGMRARRPEPTYEGRAERVEVHDAPLGIGRDDPRRLKVGPDGALRREQAAGHDGRGGRDAGDPFGSPKAS